ncbi:hypothetical protein MSG28_007389 [Choristoneura fumiferana]|uniref:Uncharacterized protein n=1 Tax=Choristoneura fumiferana TaxID=7141 RepID=A0ACC0JWW2_CHOFU|nr:hypothetical protein MSG28_007389 [Choristoneura fumiferana]
MADAKQDMNNGTSQSRSVLAKPRLGTFGSSGFGSNTFGSILRPSQLKPSNNPFLKVTDTEEVAKKPESETDKTETEERQKETKEDAPKFVPLGATGAAPRNSSHVPTPAQPASGTSGFVFGQNLSERVVIQENINNGDAGPSEHNISNGTSELLFTNAAASVKENTQEECSNSDSNSGGEGLAAAAAEYERSHARPPLPAAAVTTTGEEGEINVLQISCRLFAWESGSWRERGRGVLRLNDPAGVGVAGRGAARLVARVSGSLRVVLNTKLWPDMVVERAGSKSLRITAVDAQQQVKLFLIMGAPGDIVQLHRALSMRIAASKRAAAAAAGGAGRRAGPPPDAAETGEAPPPDDRLAPHDPADPSDTDPRADSDDDLPEHTDTKPLKRKEPADDETSPKRQRPDILIE